MPEYDLNKNAKLPSHIVRELHQNADTDGSPKAIHHTLGPGPNQAAPGNHSHDGGGSAEIQLPDSGWVDVAISSGFAQQGTQTPQVRKIGKVVYMRWGWSNTGLTANSAFAVGTIPDGYRPPFDHHWPIAGSSAATLGAGVVNSAGVVTIKTGATVAAYYLFNVSWVVD